MLKLRALPLKSFATAALSTFILVDLLTSPCLASWTDDTAHALQGTGAHTVSPPTSVEIAFSPSGGGTNLVLKAIESAKKSIRVAAFSFTSKPIARALIAAHKAGIDVQIVVDHGQIGASSHSVVAMLVKESVPVRADIVHALQHDKYIVIDNKTVETGSFNYTAAAETRNSENILVLWDSPGLAKAYTENWEALWADAEPVLSHTDDNKLITNNNSRKTH